MTPTTSVTTMTTTNQPSLSLRGLDLAAVATDAAEHLRPQFDYEEVDLVIDNPTPVRVSGDRDRLTQVITNLLGNALGHTSSRGVVTVRSGRDAAQAWVEVTDTGTGIAVGELEHVFDRFYRGTETGTGRPARAGRGIGLTIARSLARAHGRDVVASSGGPGAGATFQLTVPAS